METERLLKELENWHLSPPLVGLKPAEMTRFSFDLAAWGLCGVGDEIDAEDLNNRLSVAVCQLRALQGHSPHPSASINRRLFFLARYLRAIGLPVAAPLQLAARVIAAELHLTEPVKIPAQLLGEGCNA